MINDGKIRHKNFQFDIIRAVAATSAVSLDKIDKYEYLSGKAIVSTTASDNRRSLGHLFSTR